MTPLPHQQPAFDGATWRLQRPAWLYAGLLAGSHRNDEPGKDPWPVSLNSLGTVELPSGQLVACDPYVADSHEPAFSTKFRTGAHEVVLGRATVGPDHERNTAAVLVAGSDAITQWEIAVTPGADVSQLDDPSSYFGYGVDAGTGCFASPEGQAAATAVLAADGGMLEDPLSTALFSSPIRGVIARPAPGAPRVAMFETGWGDGYYPTWLGLAAAGHVVVAVTDFLVANDPFGPNDATASATSPDRPTGLLARAARLLRRPR